MLTAADVAEHNDRHSCWVVVQGRAYDVTDFLDSHPGGAAIILRYAGKDATEEYIPIHPPGTIEKELPLDKHLGQVNLSTFPTHPTAQKPTPDADGSDEPVSVEMCIILNDIEHAAKRALSERAWVYYSSSAEDLQTFHHNLSDWDRIQFRPRILRNVQRVNMERRILVFPSSFPFFIAPAALARLGHPDGELCLVRGASKFNIPYCSSNASSVAHEDLAQCLTDERRGGCLFFQLYVKKVKEDTVQQIRRAKRLGFKGLVITVDTPVVGIREEDDRFRMREARQNKQPYIPIWGAPSPADVDDNYVFRGAHSSTLNWDDLEWIRREWDNAGPVCIKGILTAEDAKMACDRGIDSIYLSNHGGRRLDSSPSSLRALIEIRRFYPEVFDKCEVLLDGGLRRSRDILKALCLGVTAVGIGRPFMYGLSAYGTDGVSKVIQILSDELETSMRLLGVTTLDQLRPEMVNTRDLETSIMLDIPGFRISSAKL